MDDGIAGVDRRCVAQVILDGDPGPQLRHKVNVACFGDASAQEAAAGGKWYMSLAGEQYPDGSWGRFHTQDTKRKQRCPTTETAMRRLWEMGFTREAPAVRQACAYAEGLLNDLSRWPDAWERNRWFAPAVPQFIASKLALFGSEDARYREVAALWVDMLIDCFADGYDGARANSIAQARVGVDIDGRYLGLTSVNVIMLCRANLTRIPPALQRRYLGWLHREAGEIGYSGVSLRKGIDMITRPEALLDYAMALAMLRPFEGYAEEFAFELHWLQSLRGADGLWDLGPKATRARLSDSWRQAQTRRMDQSAYLLEAF